MYVINGIEFKTKKAVKDHCRGIRDRNAVGTPEPGDCILLSGDDKTFMVDFISHLPAAKEIMRGCVVEVSVCCVQKGKDHWGFSALKADGSEQIFGFGKFGAKPEQIDRDRFLEACRNSVFVQTISYKEEYFDGFDEALCEATGELMTRSNCHVDHKEPTFAELVESFFGDRRPEVVEQGLLWVFKDNEVDSEWREFHRQKASLRCTTAKFNLTRKRT